MKKIYLTLIVLISILSVHAQQQVTVGTGQSISVFSPINRSNDYCVYEIVYLSSEINLSGIIDALAYERVDGSEIGPIENVQIFMKETTDNSLPAATYSDAGYTLVYSGDFPNDSGAGWREVILDAPFAYDGVSNLQVLTVKGYQARVANTPVTPRWYYTVNNTGVDRARRYYGNDSITSFTSLSTINFNSNIRLNFGTVGIAEISNTASVYPNPSNGQFRFTNLPDDTQSISIYSSSGQLVEEMVSGFNEINAKAFSKGLYFFTVARKNSSTVITGKFIVN